MLATPVILDGHIYGVGSEGQLRCLDAATGERIWETQAATVERALKTVNWSHPAYANQHIYARNDEEIIAASLAAP